MAFATPIAAKNLKTPKWFGPILPTGLGVDNAINAFTPNVVPNLATRGTVFPFPSTYRQAVLSALQMLFSTRPGERIYNPDYGINLESIAFEVLDSTTANTATTQIRTAIETYITWVTVISANAYQIDDNAIGFTVQAQIKGGTPNDIVTYSTSATPTA